MTALIKWLLGALMSVSLFIALAIVILPRLIDPNDFRDNIIKLVKEETGRDLTLDGQLSISVFPWLGIKTEGLSLSQPAAIGGNMLTMSSAQLRVKLLPLLQQRLEVDTVILQQPQVKLILASEKLNSFTGLANESRSESKTSQGGLPQRATPKNSNKDRSNPAASATTASVALVIQGLVISDGSLTWEDQTTEQFIRVRELNFESGNLLDPQMANINFSGKLELEDVPEPSASEWQVSVEGLGYVDSNDLSLSLQNIVGSLRNETQAIDFKMAALALHPGERLEIIQMALTNTSLRQANEPSMLDSPIQLSVRTANYSMASEQAEISDLKLSTRLAKRELNASLPQAVAHLGKATLQSASATIVSDDFAATLTSLQVSNLLDQPSYRATATINEFNLAQLLSDLEIEYTPTSNSAAKKMSGSAKVFGTSDSIQLQNLVLKLDNSSLSGSLALKNFDDLATEFDLSLDQINLDQYLPKSATADAPTISGSKALAVPMAALKDIDANGRFRADQIVSGGLDLNDIDVQVSSKEGKLTVLPTAKLYDGSLAGQFQFTQSNDDTASLKVKNTIDLVSLAKLLSAAEVTDQLSGIGSVDLDLEVNENQGVQSKSGLIKLKALNGELQGVDLAKMIERGTQGYALYQELRGKRSQSTSNFKSEATKGVSKYADVTQFAELLGTFHLDNDVLSNQDFSLSSPWMSVRGQGIIDLASQTLDYTLSLTLRQKSGSPEQLQDLADQDFEDLIDIPIPIRLTGDVRKPSFSLNMELLFKALFDRESEQAKSKYIERKLGIKDGGKLSSKELLKQVLINEVDKKEKKKQNAEATTSNADGTEAQDAKQPSKPVPYESYEDKANNGDDVIQDVPAEPETNAEPERELTEKEKKDRAKNELKRKLLEEIFK